MNKIGIMLQRHTGKTWKEAVEAGLQNSAWQRLGILPAGVSLNPFHRPEVAPTVAGVKVEFSRLVAPNHFYIFGQDDEPKKITVQLALFTQPD